VVTSSGAFAKVELYDPRGDAVLYFSSFEISRADATGTP